MSEGNKDVLNIHVKLSKNLPSTLPQNLLGVIDGHFSRAYLCLYKSLYV